MLSCEKIELGEVGPHRHREQYGQGAGGTEEGGVKGQ